METNYILEVCTGSLQSVANAVAGGAQRIELCQALELDGLTPSLGVLLTVKKCYPNLKTHVLIRPRAGDFVYSKLEKQAMLNDIHLAVANGADGIVSGALCANGAIDETFLYEMLHATDGIPFTFHRAFDVCKNPLESLEALKRAGVSRLLTSGQQPMAEQGIGLLAALVAQADNQLVVMPGGGVTSGNIRHILQATGTTEIHGSAKAGGTETSIEEVHLMLSHINNRFNRKFICHSRL